jgi:2,3-bisphosphoglycerate-independent phosphoglycerate mutase
MSLMHALIKDIVQRNETKIVLLVMDGLGGLPAADVGPGGKTELEAARTPNLDALARRSACGLHLPVAMGITPGSGPGHLALFGYDPKIYQIGRGILEALGLGMEVKKTDVALRCNYSTVRGGVVKDRRAGRIPTPQSGKLTEKLQKEIKEIDDVEVHFGAGMEHRFAVVLRFPDILEQGAADINDTDPQEVDREPMPLSPRTHEAEKVAAVAGKLVDRAAMILKDEERANYILLRGFSQMPRMPDFQEAYGLRALGVSVYPMYRGVAKLVGMEAADLDGDVAEELELLRSNYDRYDFFFVHVKKVDSYGEDGDFEAKKKVIEAVDALVPEVLALRPDVLMVTGDHSTPAALRSHSWHPVPVLLHSPHVLGGTSGAFSERECLKGELGIFPTTSLMIMALANTGRLKKFGA